ncbi:SAM-dependent methyltransferase [Alteribacter lacisalsi]|uniref:SAM-dependent methyltransferase n=1 Tax=Alteribacter lacisalsi TaxID=2045244 RepID=A0A2W0HW82_9BACI|nr:class I SAM-dependent methyltransferase [Alteribacter lacisalsi]PYZ97958.1 SAM-dependent methyltransferase [Alteribacter lacisalsi]
MRKMTGTEFNERVSFFDRMAQTDWLSSLHREMIVMAGPRKNKRIFDSGCGTGRLLARAAEKGTVLTGIDLSPRMIEASRKHLKMVCPENKTVLQTADAEQLPFDDKTFEISLCACVLFLLPDPERAFSELARVTSEKIVLLNPSENLSLDAAQVYIMEKNLKGDEKDMLMQWGRVSERRHRFSAESIRLLAEKNGFTVTGNRLAFGGLALLTQLQQA